MNRVERASPYIAIIGTFSLVVLAAALLGAFALSHLATVNSDAEKAGAVHRQADILLTKIVEETAIVRLNQNLSLIAMTEPARTQERVAVYQAIGGVAAMIDGYQKYLDAPQMPAFAKWRDAWNDYVSMNDTLNEKALNESLHNATEYYLYPMQDAYHQSFLAAINEAINENAKAGQAMARAGVAAYAQARMQIAASVTGIALICFLAAAYMIKNASEHAYHARHIKDMTARLDDTMHKIGEISTRIDEIAGRTSVIALEVVAQAGRMEKPDMSAVNQVATASHDLSEQTGVLKDTMHTILSEVEAA